ncbi:hypothetical protein SELR_pSRC400550 (plasmid) [Selenomonas ruminantium subsp. lactilytica TAM6421]|uniref:Uncharacterized protein n=1 Tax=Selenomonas ruminantium subsp. lactilytica (strain NBRC 103574 / TAM6421) TaxID=927704 RepID=I0GVB9_SELRL|nr:hypothetical protein SELR_pSRC400550 [Selenomonas ruminantium subsp. lactilytica TAM6421]
MTSGVCAWPVSIGLTENVQANHSNAGKVGNPADKADVGEICMKCCTTYNQIL